MYGEKRQLFSKKKIVQSQNSIFLTKMCLEIRDDGRITHARITNDRVHQQPSTTTCKAQAPIVPIWSYGRGNSSFRPVIPQMVSGSSQGKSGESLLSEAHMSWTI